MSEPKQSGFGAWMTEHQRRSGSSKRALASAAGISEAAWRQYERGYRSEGGQRITRVPPARVAVRIARAVDGDPVEGLKLAGYDPDGHAHLLADSGGPSGAPDLSDVDELSLVDELRHRIAGRSGRGGEVRSLRPVGQSERNGEQQREAARRRPQSDRDPPPPSG